MTLALGVRVVAWSQTAVLFNDGPVFLALASAIEQGQWAEVLAHPYHPLYPLSIALVSQLGCAPETAAVSVSIFGGVLAIAALHVYLRRAFGLEVAWLGAWLLTLHPWAVDFSSDVMSEGLYMGLYLAAFAALAQALERPALARAAGAGACAALAYLVRPEGVGLVGVAVLLLSWRLLAEKAGRRAGIASLAVLLASAALVMAPYVAERALRSGELSLSPKKSLGSLMAGDASPRALASSAPTLLAGPAEAPIWLPQSAESARGPGAVRPPRSVGGALEAALRVLRTGLAALGYEVAIFVGVGAWALRRSDPRVWRDRALWLPIAAYLGLLCLLVWGAGYLSRRHALVFLLPLLGVAALGWRTGFEWVLERWGRERAGSRLGVLGPTLVLALVLALAWGPRDARPRRADRAAVRDAAVWLAERHPGSGPVAAQKLRAAYYAGAAFVPLPSGRDAAIEDQLKGAGARWLVIDDSRLGDHLGLAEGIGRWLEPVHASRRGERSATVYALQSWPAD